MKPDRRIQARTRSQRGINLAPSDFNSGELHTRSDAVINDAVIERYVRDPATLAVSVVRAIEELLEQDPGARRLAEFYRSFYDELEHLPDHSASSVEMFITSIFPSPHVVPLFPVEMKTQGRAFSLQEEGIEIPASGAATFYDPILLLGSKESGVVVCLLREQRDRKRCRLYVLMTDLARRPNVIISFPEINFDVFVRSGTADLLFPDSDVDSDQLRAAILRFPVFEIEYRPDGHFSPPLRKVSDSRFALPTGHVLEIHSGPGGDDTSLSTGDAAYPTSIRRVAIVTEEGSTYIMKVYDGEGRVDVDGSLERAWIGLYE